jgi:tetratricopeptide (TPR) repeat protein
MLPFPIESALIRYRTALDTIASLPAAIVPTDALITQSLEVMAARDNIDTILKTSNRLTADTLATIAELDEQLKHQGKTIAPCLKTIDWKSVLNTTEKGWWWSVQPEKTNQWWEKDWIWNAVSLGCITVSIGLFGDISTRFLKGGPDTFGAIAVSAQSIGTLLTASGALTIAGKDANKRFLQHIKISDKYWHELGAGCSVGLLTIAVVGRTSLPWFANLYSDWGFQKFTQGEWGTAEELYKRAIELNPDSEQTSFRLGLLYEELQDLTPARSHYNTAARAGMTSAINNLSRLNLRDNKPESATPLLLKSLEKTDKLAPETHYSLLKNLGWARFLQGDLSEAEEKLQQAISLQKTAKLTEKNENPDNRTAIPIASPACLLAQVKTAQKEIPAALKFWEICNTYANPYIPEEDRWSITARKLLKQQDQKNETKKPSK